MTGLMVHKYASALRERYRVVKKKEKGKILDESRLPAGRSARPPASTGRWRSGFSAGAAVLWLCQGRRGILRAMGRR